MSKTIESQEEKSILVWDLLVRVFHWALVFFFLLAYFMEADRLELHSHAGYTVALLVLFRLVWGVIGSDTARFSNFVVAPRHALRYLARLVRGKLERHIGHNPAGAAMIVALLTSLLFTALSGMALFALEGSGPLANTFVMSWPGSLLENIHRISADLAMILIVMHVLGVIYTSYVYKENLSKSMLTGMKEILQREQE